MAKRDWDKLRRNDRAKGGNAIDNFRPPVRRKRNRFRNRQKIKNVCERRDVERRVAETVRRVYGEPQPQAQREKSTIRALELWNGDELIGRATFRRQGKVWECTHADPAIDWFKRVVHMDLIGSWIDRNHYTLRWLTTDDVRTAPITQSERTDEQNCPKGCPGHPSQETASQEGNTAPSLNNDTQVRPQDVQSLHGPVLERVGINNPHRIKAEGSPSGSQTGQSL